MRTLNRNLIWAGALFDELVRCGVRDVCVSPGSRSAPLALASASHFGIRDHSVLDERSAAFFALGAARSSGRPVALVCTSGTAAANYLPAVVEAHYSGVPLLLLTADRPPEERACGSGQTIDQIKMYGDYVRLFAELPPPEVESSLLLHLRRTACHAVSAALGAPPGPVHLNLPFREPLAPVRSEEDMAQLEQLDALSRVGRQREPLTRVTPSEPPTPAAHAVERLAQWMESEPRGWLVAGPLDAPEPFAHELTRLARAAGWAVLADALSSLRAGSHSRAGIVDAHDAVLRASGFVEANLPAAILRFGAMPTAKSYRLFLERHPEIRQVVVDPWGWSDPTALASDIVRADPLALTQALCNLLEPRADSGFAALWSDAGSTARSILESELCDRDTLSEPGVARALTNALPEGTTLFVASSMPVRDVDLFWTGSARGIRVLANRGANGIDGTVSSALGAAAASDGPLVLLTGDLALLHDWTGLLIARRAEIDASVIVLDNGGGGIFEFLPVARTAGRELFERHFATDQRVDLCAALQGFGLSARAIRSPQELKDALDESLCSPGVQFLVVRTDRGENRELHRKLLDAVDAALQPGGP